MPTSFTPTLARVLQDIPDTLGVIFAAQDGEAVDHVVETLPDARTLDDYTLQVLGAHAGVILNHVQNVLHLYHFGDCELLVITCEEMVLFLHALKDDYFLVLAATPDVHLAKATQAITAAAQQLLEEL